MNFLWNFTTINIQNVLCKHLTNFYFFIYIFYFIWVLWKCSHQGKWLLIFNLKSKTRTKTKIEASRTLGVRNQTLRAPKGARSKNTNSRKSQGYWNLRALRGLGWKLKLNNIRRKSNFKSIKRTRTKSSSKKSIGLTKKGNKKGSWWASLSPTKAPSSTT